MRKKEFVKHFIDYKLLSYKKKKIKIQDNDIQI